jgi:FrmR/RcnR family transcriptional regulator, repressor of frmRAB operon
LNHDTHSARKREADFAGAAYSRQIDAIERALKEGKECGDVLQLITAARGAMNGLMAELLEDHVRFHVMDPSRKASSAQAIAADELIDIVRSYLK